MSDRPLNLLALDGGGIRGLSELKILEEIMGRIKFDLNMEDDPLPADFFDLIGGTSTGGLIALLLGRLRYSVPQARAAFVKISKEVFSVSQYLHEGRFNERKLEEAVKDLVRSRFSSNDGEERLLDQQGGACKVFVCSVAAKDLNARAGPRLFRTYKVREGSTFNCKIWEACRATSAAPTYFKRIAIGAEGEEEEFLDGGLGYNNPVQQVLDEARRVFSNDREIGCIVSIGTGLASVTKYDSPSMAGRLVPAQLIKALQEMATDSDKIAEAMEKRFKNIADTYFRFSVDRGLDGISLEEWDKLSQIDKIVTALLISKRTVPIGASEAVVRISAGRPLPLELPWPQERTGLGSRISVGQLALTVQHRPRQRHFIVPKDTNRHFVERPKIWEFLEQKLGVEGNKLLIKERVALIGMSGSGKTELAVRFAELYKHQYDAVMWLDCSKENRMNDSLVQIAETVSKSTFEDARMARSYCQDWFRDHGKWLLIADNLDDAQMIRLFQSSILGGGMDGNVLATSTNPDLASVWESIEVANMTPDEGLRLLQNITGDGSTDTENNTDDMLSLVDDLGYLPLVIDQAGSFMRQQSLSLADYRRLFDSHKTQLLAHPASRPFHSDCGSIWTALDMSFEQLRESDQKASDLLFLLVLLDSNNIELEVLLSHWRQRGYWAERGEFDPLPKEQDWLPAGLEDVICNEISLRKLITSLRRFSFVRLNRGGRAVSIHTLVQIWLMNELTKHTDKTQAMMCSAIGMICCHLQKQDTFPPYVLQLDHSSCSEERTLTTWPWRQYHSISSHALRCLQHVCKLSSANEITAGQGLALLQFLHYTPFGSYEEHQALGEDVFDAVERFVREKEDSPRAASPPSDDFLTISIHIWRLILDLSCQCRKHAHGSYSVCRTCRLSNSEARDVYIHGCGQPRPPRSLAALRCLRNLLAKSPLANNSVMFLDLPSRSNSTNTSWIEEYTEAVSIYEKTVLQPAIYDVSPVGSWLVRGDTYGKNWGNMGKAVASFKKIAGTRSTEYRRSLWHLTTYWWEDGCWKDVVTALQPLIEFSIEEAITDWSHERCVIRTVSALLKLGKRTEAVQIVERVRDSYAEKGKTLRSIQNGSLLSAGMETSEAVSIENSSPQRQGSVEPWQIFLSPITGGTLTIDASPSMLVDDLLHIAGDRAGYGYPTAAAQWRLLFGGKQLEPHRMLSDYGIQKGSTIHLVFRMLGGV